MSIQVPGRSDPRAALLGTLLALALSATEAVAQPGFTVTFGRAFNSITDTVGSAVTRQTVIAAADGEYVTAGDRLRLSYEFDTGDFTTPGDWHYRLNTAGATWKAQFGANKQNAVRLGASGTWRSNGASWTAADYRGLGLIANTELHPTSAATLRFGYRLDVRRFPDLTELDQTEHDGFTSLLLNLPSRTTIIGEVHLGAKLYHGSALDQVYATSPEASSASGNRAGRAVGPALRAAAGGWTTTQYAGTQAGQVTVLARLAQSLADRTGVSLQFAERRSFGTVPPVVVTTPAAYFDDGIYDDPFASDARTLRAALRHVFGSGSQIDAFAVWMAKGYRGTSALDQDGLVLPRGDLRDDRVWRAGSELELPLFAEKTGPVALSLIVDYFFTRHRSNDAFYNYTTQTVGMGVSVSY